MNITKEALIERGFVKNRYFEIFTRSVGSDYLTVDPKICEVYAEQDEKAMITIKNCKTLDQLDSLIEMFLK